MKRKIRINFSDFWHADTLEAKQTNPIYLLLSKRFDVEICEQPDFLIYSVFGVDFIKYDCTRIFYTGENKSPNYTLCDWAFGFDYSDDPRYFRWPYYALYNYSLLTQPRDLESIGRNKDRFCAFIYSNHKAPERLQFLEKLSRYKPVDCGGTVRNNLGYRVGDKIAFLQRYKFNIAFENESHPGYTTEKILESFQGNTVPIYWGNRLIDRDFNSAAFVNCHAYDSQEQAIEFIIELDRNDALYNQYLSAPAFINNQPNEYVSETRVLDRFEKIFDDRLRQPVAQSISGRIAGWLREPRRYRMQRRARQKSQQ